MAETAVIAPSLPAGSLRSTLTKLDDELLAASAPGSPALSPTKPSTPADIPSQLPSQPTSQPTSAPSTTKQNPSTPVLALLTHPNPTASSIAPLATSDATFLCPHWNLPDSARRHRRHSSTAHTGPEAIAQTLADMRRHRTGLEFDVETAFGAGGGSEDVAVFGKAKWESGELGRRVQVPFAVWAKVDKGGRVEFLELVGE